MLYLVLNSKDGRSVKLDEPILAGQSSWVKVTDSKLFERPVRFGGSDTCAVGESGLARLSLTEVHNEIHGFLRYKTLADICASVGTDSAGV